MDVQIILEKIRPYKIEGKFQDVYPSTKRGSIVWHKDKELWKKSIVKVNAEYAEVLNKIEGRID